MQETLDQLGAHVKGECGQKEPEKSQAIRKLASQASAQYGGVFSKPVESTKE
ncbi:MAG: hypothetical protein Q8O59_04380 [bacterium]|nr:hypothetical protein [bacterium]